jgi:hypothetical protein
MDQSVTHFVAFCCLEEPRTVDSHICQQSTATAHGGPVLCSSSQLYAALADLPARHAAHLHPRRHRAWPFAVVVRPRAEHVCRGARRRQGTGRQADQGRALGGQEDAQRAARHQQCVPPSCLWSTVHHDQGLTPRGPKRMQSFTIRPAVPAWLHQQMLLRQRVQVTETPLVRCARCRRRSAW